MKKTDNRCYQTEADVKAWIFSNSPATPTYLSTQALTRGIFVDGRLRKEILTGENQGRVIVNGCVLQIVFKSIGGGVYKVSI